MDNSEQNGLSVDEECLDNSFLIKEKSSETKHVGLYLQGHPGHTDLLGEVETATLGALPPHTELPAGLPALRLSPETVAVTRTRIP